MNKKIMSIADAAKRYSVCPDTILRLIYKQKIPAIKVGRHWKLPISATDKKLGLDKYLEKGDE
jgi:excisionase family DNA binding protein